MWHPGGSPFPRQLSGQSIASSCRRRVLCRTTLVGSRSDRSSSGAPSWSSTIRCRWSLCTHSRPSGTSGSNSRNCPRTTCTLHGRWRTHWGLRCPQDYLYASGTSLQSQHCLLGEALGHLTQSLETPLACGHGKTHLQLLTVIDYYHPMDRVMWLILFPE